MLGEKCLLQSVLQDPYVFVVLLFMLSGAEAASVMDAYRLVQMDIDGVALGSRSVRLNQYATVYAPDAQLFRSIVIIPFAQVTEQIVKDVIAKDTGMAGIIFTLPQDMDTKPVDEEDLQRFQQIEELLLTVSIATPVYFVVDNDDLENVVRDIKTRVTDGASPTAATGGYLVVVKGKGTDANPIKNPQATNLHGMLSNTEGGKAGRGNAPTIAITAHYDTFAAAPGLAVGSSDNGSGALVLLTLARMFSSLYSAPESVPQPNILFLLTAAGELDYMGLRHWLKTADNRVLDSLEFVICLDALSDWMNPGADELYLHYSKPPKEPIAQQWYGRVEQAARIEGVKLTQVHKKVNLAAPQAAWGHEHFAQQKLLAATLSAVRSSRKPFGASSILDRPSSLNLTFLAQTARIVGEAISMRLFEDQGQDLHLFKAGGALDASMPFMTQWASLFGRTPRMVPYSGRDSPLEDAMLGVLREHTTKASKLTFSLDKSYVFYGGDRVEMSVYKTAGAVFDLTLFGIVLSYLAALFVSIRVLTQGWNSFVAIFVVPPKKGKKGTSGSR